MKFFVPLILIFATLASTTPLNQEKDESKQIMMDCAKEFNIPLSEFMDELQELFKLPYDNSTGHCFVKCVVEKQGLFYNDSGFKIESIQNKFQSENHEIHGRLTSNAERLAMALKCAKSTNEKTYANSCERAYRGVECFFNELKDQYFKKNPESKYKMECVEELKIPFSEMKHFDSYKANRNNPTFHCYMKCFYEKVGILEENNILKVDYFYDKLAGGFKKDCYGDHLAKIEKCTKETHQGAANDCEHVFRRAECILDTIESFRADLINIQKNLLTSESRKAK